MTLLKKIVLQAIFVKCLEYKCPSSRLGQRRIIDGREATEGTWPWIVSIQRPDGKPFCGGSILDERHILTAAHCCTSKTYGVLRNDSPLIIGEHDLRYNSGNERWYYPKLVHIHPLYNPDKFIYDICIIETECMQLNNPSLRAPVCLPSIKDHIKGRNRFDEEVLPCFTAGWGVTAFKYAGPEYSDKLMFIRVEAFTKFFCLQNSDYQLFQIHDGSQFCAGNLDTLTQDTCYADSGGPLVCIKDEHPILYGITSTGIGCGNPKYPGIYTKVANMMDFIELVLEGNNNTCGSKESKESKPDIDVGIKTSSAMSLPISFLNILICCFTVLFFCYAY